MDPLVAEMTASAIGVENIIRGRPKLNRRLLARGLAAERDALGLLRRLLERERPTRPRALPTLSFDTTNRLLSTWPTEQATTALAARFHAPDVLTGILEATGRVAVELNVILPRRERPGLANSPVELSNQQEWARFRRRYQIGMDPWTIFQRAGAGMLAPSDIEWLTKTWPAFAAMVARTVPMAISKSHTATAAYRIAPSKERLMSMLMNQPGAESEVTKVLQAAYANPMPEELTEPASTKRPGAPVKLNIKAEATEGQRTEAGS